MRKSLIIIGLLSSIIVRGQDITDCPYGDKKIRKDQVIDSMKNRGIAPKKYTTIPFSYIYGLELSDDYSPCAKAVTVKGYMLETQEGSAESCNCHSKYHKDTHIYLVKDSSITDKGEAVIVEVTPRFREQFGTTSEIKKKFSGKAVYISGYLFQDEEHKQNSKIDNGKGLLWRHTTWEVHPVTNIQLIEN